MQPFVAQRNIYLQTNTTVHPEQECHVDQEKRIIKNLLIVQKKKYTELIVPDTNVALPLCSV